MTEEIFVFGASGHAKVVIDAAEQAGRQKVLFICDDAKGRHGSTLMGYAVVGGRSELLERAREARRGIVGIGDNAARAAVAGWLRDNGFSFTTVLHPSAAIGREVELGDGTVVFAGCVINSGTRIGQHVIVNTASSVDHDCEIGNGAHIAPGVRLCGGVTIGAGTLVGAGTTIIPGVRVGAGAVIGAGSTVLRDVSDGARAGGSPCRELH